MNPFVNRITNQQWIIPVTSMCVVLGFMISMAWVTESNRSSRLSLIGADQRTRVNEATVDIDKFKELSDQVAKLQKDKTELENALAKKGEDSELFNKSLQESKLFAGLTELEGPGVTVTLRDKPGVEPGSAMEVSSDFIIHDTDVLRVVNELFAAGAEAVSVNNIRVSAGSSFRCVGPTILVNDVKIASPVVIRAIGDTATLYGALTMPGPTTVNEIRGMDASMVQIERVKLMRLPAYVGNTQKRVGKVPEPNK